MDILSNDYNPEHLNGFMDANVPIQGVEDNWNFDDFNDPFNADNLFSNYTNSPLSDTFTNPYDEICMGLESEVENISGSSSDSGLSSDNLDVDLINETSIAINDIDQSSDISDKVNESSFQENDSNENNNYELPKVVVQKVPQLNTVTTSENLGNFFKNTKPLGKINSPKEIKIVKVAPLNTNNNIKNKNVTIQINKSNGKIQTNPGTFFINKQKIAEVKKAAQNNSKSFNQILIPITFKGVKELKTVKVIKAISNEKFVCQNESLIVDRSESDSDREQTCNVEDMDYESEIKCKETKYPKLILTSEEKRLLAKEGISLPQHYPLTKNEERELKRIRRKIRNKISAQDSRKRKKDYVTGLEARVKQCSEENQNLMKRIKLLQLQNQSLVSQMKKMQALLTKGTDKITNPTTCLMVLLMSLALITAPNLNLSKRNKDSSFEDFTSKESGTIQNRNLLSDTKSSIIEPGVVKQGEKINLKNNFIDFDVDDKNWYEMTKADAENNSKYFSHNQIKNDINKINNYVPAADDIIKDVNIDGDTLDLFSTNFNFLNFDLTGGDYLLDDFKLDLKNEGKPPDFNSLDATTGKQLNVISFPR